MSFVLGRLLNFPKKETFTISQTHRRSQKVCQGECPKGEPPILSAQKKGGLGRSTWQVEGLLCIVTPGPKGDVLFSYQHVATKCSNPVLFLTYPCGRALQNEKATQHPHGIPEHYSIVKLAVGTQTPAPSSESPGSWSGFVALLGQLLSLSDQQILQALANSGSAP